MDQHSRSLPSCFHSCRKLEGGENIGLSSFPILWCHLPAMAKSPTPGSGLQLQLPLDPEMPFPFLVFSPKEGWGNTPMGSVYGELSSIAFIHVSSLNHPEWIRFLLDSGWHTLSSNLLMCSGVCCSNLHWQVRVKMKNKTTCLIHLSRLERSWLNSKMALGGGNATNYEYHTEGTVSLHSASRTNSSQLEKHFN